MPQTFDDNPVMRILGLNAHSDLIQWIQGLENSRHQLAITNDTRNSHNIVRNETFRLDQQKCFVEHGMTWANLAVQTRDGTLFTVYVQLAAYENGDVSNGSVWEAIKKGAHKGIEHQTVFATRASQAQPYGGQKDRMWRASPTYQPLRAVKRRCRPCDVPRDDIAVSFGRE